jgi:hypothetical protein
MALLDHPVTARTLLRLREGAGGGDCAGGIFVVGYSAYKKEKLEKSLYRNN